MGFRFGLRVILMPFLEGSFISFTFFIFVFWSDGWAGVCVCECSFSDGSFFCLCEEGFYSNTIFLGMDGSVHDVGAQYLYDTCCAARIWRDRCFFINLSGRVQLS